MTTHTDTNVKIIENADLDDVRPGDHLTWTSTKTYGGATLTERLEGIAHERDDSGDWRAAGRAWITDGMGTGTTLTIRRPVSELPTKPESVILPNDGHEFIEVAWDGNVWHASEAMLSEYGWWHGVWRRADDRGRLRPSGRARRSDAASAPDPGSGR